jgi:hypothetical protein
VAQRGIGGKKAGTGDLSCDLFHQRKFSLRATDGDGIAALRKAAAYRNEVFRGPPFEGVFSARVESDPLPLKKGRYSHFRGRNRIREGFRDSPGTYGFYNFEAADDFVSVLVEQRLREEGIEPFVNAEGADDPPSAAANTERQS